MKNKRDPWLRRQELATTRALVTEAEARTGSLLRPTVPLYREERHREPELFGSGVLLAIDDIRFLLTAGHVFDDRQKGRIGAGMPLGFYPADGAPTRLRTPGARTDEEDRIDVGAWRLSGALWEGLDPSDFVTLTEVDLEAPVAARHTYTLIGFPVSVNRRAIDGERAKAGAFRLAGLELDRPAYNAEGIDPLQCVMIGFEKRSMLGIDGQRTAPDLNGTSGGGIWRFGRRLRTTTGTPKLSAIMTECHPRGKHRYILGTRIQLIIEALGDKYPDVMTSLSAHNIL